MWASRMKHFLTVGLAFAILLLAEEARSSSLGHKYSSIGDYNLNYDSEEEVAFYQGKDSTFKYSPESLNVTKIFKAFGSCEAKYPLTSDEREALKNQDMDIEFSHDAKCFFACMFKATDLLKGGRIMTEHIVEYLDEYTSGLDNSREIIAFCNKEVSESEPDLCEYVYKMTRCWSKKIIQS